LECSKQRHKIVA